MKTLIRLAAAAILTVSAAGIAGAAEYTKGVVQKVDTKASKLTIKHQELKNLDMPAMTMVFAVSDPKMNDEVEEGESVEFVAERLRGKLTVVELK